MGTVTHSLVHQFASMKPTEFGATIEPKWQVADRLVKEVRTAVEKQQLTPLDGARVISSIAATLFGYDEFICARGSGASRGRSRYLRLRSIEVARVLRRGVGSEQVV